MSHCYWLLLLVSFSQVFDFPELLFRWGSLQTLGVKHEDWWLLDQNRLWWRPKWPCVGSKENKGTKNSKGSMGLIYDSRMICGLCMFGGCVRNKFCNKFCCLGNGMYLGQVAICFSQSVDLFNILLAVKGQTWLGKGRSQKVFWTESASTNLP